MEQQLPPSTGTNSNIKQQFQEMNQGAQQNSTTQEEQQRQAVVQRKETEKNLKEIMPYLELQAKATKLEMELVRNDVLLGRMNPQSIQGPYGKLLETEMTEIQLKWATVKMEANKTMADALEQKKQLEKMQQDNAEIEGLQSNGWTVTFLQDITMDDIKICDANTDIIIHSLTPELPTVNGTVTLDIMAMDREGLIKITK